MVSLFRRMSIRDTLIKASPRAGLWVLALIVFCAAAGRGEEAVLPWDVPELFKVPQVFPAPEVQADGVESLYFEGPEYQGRPTRVFAFFGLPKGATKENRVPAMVLVHGGGGTAFASWVRLWNERGYAAIAFDHCGHLPRGRTAAWEANPLGGPDMAGAGEAAKPVKAQWMYHAVANTILAHSWLRSRPEVDAARIGMTGISWGGVLASTVAGIDTRFRFVAPVYGCGNLTEDFGDGSQFIGRKNPPGLVARWKALWDPCNYLPRARAPFLWVTGTNDFAFTLHALKLSYQLPRGPRTLCVRVRMPHGHGGPGESPEEIRVFADAFLKGGRPLARITGQEREGDHAQVTFESGVEIASAELNYTLDHGVWQERRWQTLAASLDQSGNRATATLPVGTTAYFFNIIDARKLVVSSEHEVLPTLQEQQ